MVKNKQNTEWSSSNVEEVLKRLTQVEAENIELKKFLGILETRLAQLEGASTKQTEQPGITFNEFINRLKIVEQENAKLREMLKALEARIASLEDAADIKVSVSTATTVKSKPAPTSTKVDKQAKQAKPTQTKPAQVLVASKDEKTKKKNDDDDFDLFEDEPEEESEEKKRITEERLKAYNAKKTNKPAVIAKSSVLLDVKVWDDETDMTALEKAVRGIVMDGLVWGSSKLVPVAYGVKKLQIQCVIEDDKVSTEALDEQICAFDDYVQSVDIAAFNKI
jgi:translation elongation factor EF-1beta